MNIRPGTYGLSVDLIRDLSWKYDHPAATRPEWRDHAWACLGHYDWIRPKRVTDLSELPPQLNDQSIPGIESDAWELQRLLLFALDSDNLTPERVVSRLLPDKNNIDKCACYWIHLEINLSRAILVKEHYRTAFQSLITLIRSSLGLSTDEYALFGSLSRPELMLLGALDHPRDLDHFQNALHALSKLRIQELVSECTSDGHVCSRLAPTVGLNLRRLGDKHNGNDIPYTGGPRVISRVWLDVGHQRTIDEVAKGRHLSNLMTYGSHNTLLVSRSLEQAAATFNAIIDDNNDWRRRNYISSHSECLYSIRNWERTSPHGPWQLSERLAKTVPQACESLKDFIQSTSLIVGTTRDLFLQALREFQNGLYRQEALGATLDLVPFIQQLAAMLKAEDIKEYLAGAQTDDAGRDRWEVFIAEFRRMTELLLRAVRNRVEHHTIPGSPPAPVTFVEGSCKILDVVSRITHDIYDLFVRFDSARATSTQLNSARYAQPFDGTSPHGGLVCVSDSSIVQTRPLFSRYEEWYCNTHPGLKYLADQPQNTWSAKLLSYAIPRTCLVAPNVILTTLLHEVAELTDFPSPNRKTRPLRQMFIFYAWTLARDVLAHRLDAFLKDCGRRAVDRNSPYGRLAHCAKADEWCADAQDWLTRLVNEIIRSEFDKTRKSKGDPLAVRPEDSLINLGETVINHLIRSDDDSPAIGPSPFDRWEKQRFADWLRKYQSHFKSLSDCLVEIIADTGMFVMLLSDIEDDRERRVTIIDSVYDKLFMSLNPKQHTSGLGVPASPSRRAMLMMRWKLQVAASLGGNVSAAETHIKQRYRNTHFIDNSWDNDDTSRLLQSFFRGGSPPNLAKKLAKFRPYSPDWERIIELPPGSAELVDTFRQWIELTPSFETEVGLIWQRWCDGLPTRLIEPVIAQ